jgi:hypothetical protein
MKDSEKRLADGKLIRERKRQKVRRSASIWLVHRLHGRLNLKLLSFGYQNVSGKQSNLARKRKQRKKVRKRSGFKIMGISHF